MPISTDAMRSRRGTKRVCRSCEVRFYDLGRDPTVCPSCGASLPMSGFEQVRQEPAGYQSWTSRSQKRNALAVKPDDDGSSQVSESDATDAGDDDDETVGTDGDVLLEEEGDDDVADLIVPDEPENGAE